jgi:hypothetical protein
LILIVKKCYSEGYSSNNDVYELIKLRIEHESKSRLESLILSLIVSVGQGIVKLKCNVCKKPLPGVFLDSRSKSVKAPDQISMSFAARANSRNMM